MTLSTAARCVFEGLSYKVRYSERALHLGRNAGMHSGRCTTDRQPQESS
jgi:hypothetical protein